MARKVKYYSAKRRAVYAAGEKIDHLEVFERDEWICGICSGPIDRNLRKPNPRAASLDHIVSVSDCILQNWAIQDIHTKDNVQASHTHCNLEKAQGFIDFGLGNLGMV